MDEEIVLDRGQTTVMKLDADEQALMDEIQISAPRPKPVPRPNKAYAETSTIFPATGGDGCFCKSQ